MQSQKFLKKEQFLPTIVTTSGSDWREKIKEANKLGLQKVAVFLTGLKIKERKELYQLLESSNIKNIPLVHLRNDCKLWEIDYLVDRYQTKVFNIHSQNEYPLIYDWTKYKNIVYIENVYSPWKERGLKQFAGICLDFSHLENDRLLRKDIFRHNLEIIKKYPLGCNHISAVRKAIHIDKKGYKRYDIHYLKDLAEFDYLKNYPLIYFSRFIAIELENTLREQLIAIDYIVGLIIK